MLITKTPLRISFVGGGSDLSSYYTFSPGSVISTSINKFVYLNVNKKFDQDIRISYSKTEICSDINEIQHPIVRECLKECNIHGSVEISSMADIPSSGSGLGSSSAFTVGLLKALYAYKGIFKNNHFLAEKASDIEINKCGEPIGKQDQFGVSIGGMKKINFLENGQVVINRCAISQKRKDSFREKLLMLYTGRNRSASAILANQSKELISSKNKRSIMKEMVNLVDNFTYELMEGSIDNLGSILHENWERKKSISSSISSSWINEAYEEALKLGAKGGKILGAGNGGFFLFFCDPTIHNAIINGLPGMKKFDFNFDETGSQIVYSD